MAKQKIDELVSFFEKTPFGETALHGTVDEAIRSLDDRTFYRLAELNYSNPDYKLLEDAIIEYRRITRIKNN